MRDFGIADIKATVKNKDTLKTKSKDENHVAQYFRDISCINALYQTIFSSIPCTTSKG